MDLFGFQRKWKKKKLTDIGFWFGFSGLEFSGSS
jgi:hypothetical protein